MRVWRRAPQSRPFSVPRRAFRLPHHLARRPARRAAHQCTWAPRVQEALSGKDGAGLVSRHRRSTFIHQSHHQRDGRRRTAHTHAAQVGARAGSWKARAPLRAALRVGPQGYHHQAIPNHHMAQHRPPCAAALCIGSGHGQPRRVWRAAPGRVWDPVEAAGAAFLVYGLRSARQGGEGDGGLRELIVKIHSSRTHAYTDSILEYRLEVAPAQLVRLASAGIQGLRKPADTTYDVLPSESEDDSDGDPEETGRRKKRGKGPPPEPDSHLRVWMPACMVRPALSELVERYEASLEAKRTKKSKGKQRAAPATTKTKASSSKRKVVKPPVPHVDSDAEEFDLNVSCSSEDEEGGGGRSSPPPRPPAQATLPASRSQHAESIYKRPTQVSAQQQILDISTSDEEADEAPSKKFHSPLSSPSKVLQKLDLNLNPVANLCGAPPPPPSVSSPSACQGPPPSALRPFPMAFEEEESSDDENGYPSADPFATTATALRAQPRTSTPPPPPPRRQPLPIIPQEEGQLSSDDDPDMVIADLPVLVDTRDLSPEQGPPISGGSTRPASQTSPRRRASRYHPFPLPAKEARTDEGRIARAQGAAAETSIISISSGGSDDDDDLVLAPLLVARSRTLVPQKVTAKGRDAEDEVIDLT
jgi:hypothetical protein